MNRPRRTGKAAALRAAGALNPHPERVTDEEFLAKEFFDPDDLVQVKYEMLRKAMKGDSVTRAAAAFGLTRPTFYQAKVALEAAGLPGLLPRRRGPRGAYKLKDEVLDFITERLAEEPELRPRDLAERVRERFGFSIHPRSIERALLRKQTKKGLL